MRIDKQIEDEKLQYNIYREAAKVSVLSAVKINNYEYFTGEKTLYFNQEQKIGQTEFFYYPLGKAFEKVQTKYGKLLKKYDKTYNKI